MSRENVIEELRACAEDAQIPATVLQPLLINGSYAQANAIMKGGKVTLGEEQMLAALELLDEALQAGLLPCTPRRQAPTILLYMAKANQTRAELAAVHSACPEAEDVVVDDDPEFADYKELVRQLKTTIKSAKEKQRKPGKTE